MEDLGDRAGYPPGRERAKEFGLRYLRLDRDLWPGMAVTIEPGPLPRPRDPRGSRAHAGRRRSPRPRAPGRLRGRARHPHRGRRAGHRGRPRGADRRHPQDPRGHRERDADDRRRWCCGWPPPSRRRAPSSRRSRRPRRPPGRCRSATPWGSSPACASPCRLAWPEAYDPLPLSHSGHQFRQAYNQGPEFRRDRWLLESDGDPWAINVIGHGLFGAEVYGRVRQCGGGPWQALAFAAGTSVVWEYGIESWSKRPSAVDLGGDAVDRRGAGGGALSDTAVAAAGSRGGSGGGRRRS